MQKPMRKPKYWSLKMQKFGAIRKTTWAKQKKLNIDSFGRLPNLNSPVCEKSNSQERCVYFRPSRRLFVAALTMPAPNQISRTRQVTQITRVIG